MKHLLVLLLFACFGLNAQALEPGDDAGSLACRNGAFDGAEFSACKALPSHPGWTVYAEVTSAEEYAYDLEVTVVDTARDKVVAHLLAPGAITDDAFRLSGISIDTARWTVEKGSLVFGVSTRRHVYSAVVGGDLTALYLLRLSGGNLDIILDGITTDSIISGDDECTTSTSRTLAVGNTRHHGLADLVGAEVRDEDAQEHCAGNPSRRRRFTLQFDGKRYGVSDDLRG